jgi:hypothetical protein
VYICHNRKAIVCNMRKLKKKQEANTGGGVSVMGDVAASGEGIGDDRGNLSCPGDDNIPGMIGQFSIAD